MHGDGEAFEVEFVGYDGCAVALVTLEREQMSPAWSGRTCMCGKIARQRHRIQFIDRAHNFGSGCERSLRPLCLHPFGSAEA